MARNAYSKSVCPCSDDTCEVSRAACKGHRLGQVLKTRHHHAMPWLTAAALLTLAALTATPVQALPRYTAVYGQSCVLCHVNPTGGGMRSPGSLAPTRRINRY